MCCEKVSFPKMSRSVATSFDERVGLLRSENRPYTSLGSVHQNKCKVYKKRWYILALFSIVASLNNVIWNSWGPIQGTAQTVFGWDETTITLLADWGPISYVVAVVPMSWLMDEKGECNAMLGKKSESRMNILNQINKAKQSLCDLVVNL